MTTKRNATTAVDDRRLFPAIDRWLTAWIVLETVCALIPLLPLLVASAALATPLARSRWRMIVLWALAGVLSLVVAAPFLVGLFDLQLVENGPVQIIRPS